jgi:hypothetical protein
VLAVLVAPVREPRLAATLLADATLPLQANAERAARVGAEVSLVRLLMLRAGYSSTRSLGTAASRWPSAGIGLAFRGVRVDLAREGIGSEVGERFHLGISASGDSSA